MAKKKTNGFHLFANSRRETYEQQTGGRRLSQKMIIEMASNEWSKLSKTDQAAWLSHPKQQLAACQQKPPTAAPTATYQGRSCPPASGASPSHRFGGSGSYVKKSHVVEQELFKRTYKTGLDRATAREEFYGNLLWREKDRLDDILNRRWGVVVLSPDGDIVANEIICLCMEESKIVAEMRIHRLAAKRLDGEKLSSLDCQWDIAKPEDINTACIRMNKFLQSCCYNYILVPAHQQGELSAILHQMKQTRDDLHNRDTQSIRLDRLICIEDAVHMMRKLKNLPLVNNEVDQNWEQLTGEWDKMTPLRHARAVANYFLSSLEPETAQLDEEEEEELRRQQQLAEEKKRKRLESERDASRHQDRLVAEKKDQEEEQPATGAQPIAVAHTPNWVTVSPQGYHFTRADRGQTMPHFVKGQLMTGTGPSLGPALTPPDHISPRSRRPLLPRRWRHPSELPPPPAYTPFGGAGEQQGFLHTNHHHQPPHPPHPQLSHSPPFWSLQQQSPSHQPQPAAIQRPPDLPLPFQDEWNPFAQPPQLVQKTEDLLFQSVSRWLDSISLDPAPVDDEEEEGQMVTTIDLSSS